MASQGTVKFFNTEKGFGFIGTEDQGDVFVHINDLAGDVPVEGDEVFFDAIYDDYKQKTKASNVTGGTGGPRDSFPKGGGKGKGGKGKGKGKYGDSYGGDSYGGGSYGGGYY